MGLGEVLGLSNKSQLASIATNVMSKANIAQEAWITPTLINGWVSTIPVRYFKDTIGFIHLSGAVNGGSSGTTIFTLPSGYRPTQTTSTLAFDGESLSMLALTIYSNGAVVLWGGHSSYVILDLAIFRNN